MPDILVEGYPIDDLLSMPSQQFQAFVLHQGPVVVQIGSARVLGAFAIEEGRLILELGHIDGGGEGALVALASLASRYAAREGLAFIEWRVHAISCAKPNLRLRRVLERRGFVRREVPTIGECYFLRVETHNQPIEPLPAAGRLA